MPSARSLPVIEGRRVRDPEERVLRAAFKCDGIVEGVSRAAATLAKLGARAGTASNAKVVSGRAVTFMQLLGGSSLHEFMSADY